MKNQQLIVFINNNELKISIGVDLLQHAVEVGRFYGGGDIKITNKQEFLEGFIRELKREDSNGSTLLHVAFDSAVSQMLENGERGVDLLADI